MAGSTSNLDLIATAQAQKEVTANALFDAASTAMLFGRRASTSAALTWGYYGGTMMVSGTPTTIANGSVALTANATNYVEANIAGVVSKNTTGFSAGATPLYTVVTGASTVTSYTDQRTFLFVVQSQPFDLACYYPGAPSAALVLVLIPVARSVAFAASLAGSIGTALVAATAQTDFDIKVNATSVGTMRFAAGATSASFIAGSAITMVAGDSIKVVAPASPDPTISGISFVLKGTH